MIKYNQPNLTLRGVDMLYKKIDLDERYPDANLTFYVHDDAENDLPMIVVCPGGGYRFLSGREAAPIAEYYYNAGFNSCVLRYSIGKRAVNYAPMIEVGMAIKYIRKHAEELKVKSDAIFTCGFSAGGHLAASAGILWDKPEVLAVVGEDDLGISCPNGMILSYPVITSGSETHKGSIANLCGNVDYTVEEGERFSLNLHVKPSTPPMFIWHTYTDRGVHIHNATSLMEAYIQNGIPFEAHIFPKGPHGMSLANEVTWEGNPDMVDPHVAKWIDLSVEWVNAQ